MVQKEKERVIGLMETEATEHDNKPIVNIPTQNTVSTKNHQLVPPIITLLEEADG